MEIASRNVYSSQSTAAVAKKSLSSVTNQTPISISPLKWFPRELHEVTFRTSPRTFRSYHILYFLRLLNRKLLQGIDGILQRIFFMLKFVFKLSDSIVQTRSQKHFFLFLFFVSPYLLILNFNLLILKFYSRLEKSHAIVCACLVSL